MLCYGRINVSEAIQTNEKSEIFVTIGVLDKEVKFQADVYNGCHDVLMISNLRDIVILNIHGADTA